MWLVQFARQEYVVYMTRRPHMLLVFLYVSQRHKWEHMLLYDPSFEVSTLIKLKLDTIPKFSSADLRNVKLYHRILW